MDRLEWKNVDGQFISSRKDPKFGVETTWTKSPSSKTTTRVDKLPGSISRYVWDCELFDFPMHKVSITLAGAQESRSARFSLTGKRSQFGLELDAEQHPLRFTSEYNSQGTLETFAVFLNNVSAENPLNALKVRPLTDKLQEVLDLYALKGRKVFQPFADVLYGGNVDSAEHDDDDLEVAMRQKGWDKEDVASASDRCATLVALTIAAFEDRIPKTLTEEDITTVGSNLTQRMLTQLIRLAKGPNDLKETVHFRALVEGVEDILIQGYMAQDALGTDPKFLRDKRTGGFSVRIESLEKSLIYDERQLQNGEVYPHEAYQYIVDQLPRGLVTLTIEHRLHLVPRRVIYLPQQVDISKFRQLADSDSHSDWEKAASYTQALRYVIGDQNRPEGHE